MLVITYYFLQVILCSAVMMGYYWLVLRNKRFHQYNRFYLLAIALLSWIVPLIKIQWNRPLAGDPNVMHFLSVVADNNSEMEETVNNKGFQWNWDAVAAGVYFVVAGFLLFFIVKAFIKLYRLLKTHSCRHVEDVYLILTQAKGTPFSFFRYIFWNEEIDLRSESGKQILLHELAHVRQRHSIDKIFIQLLLVAGWFNPFFWLLRREMDMIHEFIADKKAVHNGDTASLAQMLLTAAYPQQKFALAHPFFFSPIKRRLQMLTNNKDPRFTYVRRLVVLPLLAIVVMLFAFRNKEYRSHQPISVETVMENVVGSLVGNSKIADPDNSSLTGLVYKFNKTYTVVIDAGHGGKDIGSENMGAQEKDITLLLARKIKLLNNNENIRIVLTRDNDIYQSVVDKANIANANKADLFVSLHCNTADNKAIGEKESKTTGIDLFIASKDKAKDYIANYRFANHMATTLQKVNQLNGIRSRQNGIWVLQAVNCPSVLIEAGYMTNKQDLDRLQNSAYQQQVADAILTGIQRYLRAGENQAVTVVTDTVVVHGRDSSIKMGDLNKKTDEIAITKNKESLVVTNMSKAKSDTFPVRLSFTVRGMAAAPLVILDGEKINADEWNTLDPNTINRMNVIKGVEAIARYGEDAKNGVIEIITKKTAPNETKEVNYVVTNMPKDNKEGNAHNILFTETQIVPSFPGGNGAWAKYLLKNLNTALLVENGAPAGKYTVSISFIVDKDGTLSSVKAENDPGYGAAAEAVRLIGKGPNWRPAIQNGIAVRAKHMMNIVFNVQSKQTAGTTQNEKIFQQQLKEQMANNSKSYFVVNGKSVVTTANGAAAWVDVVTDVVIVDGRKININELNTKYQRSSFVQVAASDYAKKYGKAVLLLSSRNLSVKEVQRMLGVS